MIVNLEQLVDKVIKKAVKDIDGYILADLIYDEFGEDVIYNGDGTWTIPE